MAQNQDNTAQESKNAANDVQKGIRDTVEGAIDAGKAAAKFASGDYAGAALDALRAVKKLIKPVLIILGVHLLIIIMVATYISQVPVMIWKDITQAYTNWSYTKTVEVINEALGSGAEKVSDDIIEQLDATFPKGNFKNARDEFFSDDNGNGISTIDVDGDYVFGIANASTSTDDIVIFYSDSNTGDYYQYTITGTNSLTSLEVNYTEIINAYIKYREKYPFSNLDGVSANQDMYVQTAINEYDKGAQQESNSCLKWVRDIYDMTFEDKATRGGSAKALVDKSSSQYLSTSCLLSDEQLDGDFDNIPKGSIIIADKGTNGTYPYGHVGIYDGDNHIYHNYSGTLTKDTIKEYIKRCTRNGCKMYWAWLDDIDLSIGASNSSVYQAPLPNPNTITTQNGYTLNTTYTVNAGKFCECALCGDSTPDTTTSGYRLQKDLENVYIAKTNAIPIGSIIKIADKYFTVAETGGSRFDDLTYIELYEPSGHKAAGNFGTQTMNIEIVYFGDGAIDYSNGFPNYNKNYDVVEDEEYYTDYQNAKLSSSEQSLGIIGRERLKNYLISDAVVDTLFNVEYYVGPAEEKVAAFDDTSISMANDIGKATQELTKTGDEDPCFYTFKIDVSCNSNNEKIEVNNGCLTYNTTTQSIFKLSDDEMQEVAEKSALSSSIIEAAMATTDDVDAVNLQEESTLSFSEIIVDRLLAGNEVKLLIQGTGAVTNAMLDTDVISELCKIAIDLYDNHAVCNADAYLDITNEDGFYKIYKTTIDNTPAGDSGMFITRILQSKLKKSTFTVYDTLFGDAKLYSANDYLTYFTENKMYTELNEDTYGSLGVGDILFLKKNVEVDGTNKEISNYAIGFVTNYTYNILNSNIEYIILNEECLNDNNTIANYNYDYFKDTSSVTLDKKTIFLKTTADWYVSGYVKLNYSTFANKYNETYATQVTINQSVVSKDYVDTGGNGELGYPTTSRTISAGYPNYSSGKYHGGVDFPVSVGTSICAAEDGVVTITKKLNYSYGHYVVIYHGDGLSTLYAHNSKLLVEPGDKVTKGQVIALSGSTGNSTGPHCHFEVLKGSSSQVYPSGAGTVSGRRVNPLAYLN